MKKLLLAVCLLGAIAVHAQPFRSLQVLSNSVLRTNFSDFFTANSNALNAAVFSGGYGQFTNGLNPNQFDDGSLISGAPITNANLIGPVTLTDALSITNGGTGAAMTDPGQDAFFVWDFSEGEGRFATLDPTLTYDSGAIGVNAANLAGIPQSGVASLESDLAARALAATTITIEGTPNQITSSAGAQDLSSNRTVTLSFPNSVEFPGNVNVASNITAGSFSGDGSGLTNLPSAGSPTYNNTQFSGGGSSTNVKSGAQFTNTLFYSGATLTVDMQTRRMRDDTTQYSLLWQERELRDASGVKGLDWAGRKLFESDGTTIALNWSSGLVGNGIGMTNIQGASIASGGDVAYTGSGNNGNLATTVDTLQELNDAVDNLDGSTLSNLNASNLADGTVPLNRLSNINSNQLDPATFALATNLPAGSGGGGGSATLGTFNLLSQSGTNSGIMDFSGKGYGSAWYITLTNTLFVVTPTNIPTTNTFMFYLYVKQPSTGTCLVTFTNATFSWVDGYAPVVTTNGNAVDVYTFINDPFTNTILHGVLTPNVHK